MANRQLFSLGVATATAAYLVPTQKADGTIELQKLTITELFNLLPADLVTYARMQDVEALAVVGNATNSVATPTGIAAASDHQVMRRSGTAIAFGAVNLAQAAATTGALTVDRGGTGVATLTGIPLAAGTSAFTAATQGTDYWKPGGTDVALADGGSGSSTAAGARTNFGLGNRVLGQSLRGVPPATLGAAPITRVGGSTPVENVYQGWAFDGTADEMVDFAFMVPTWFPASTGVSVKFATVSDATSGNQVFQGAFRALVAATDDVDVSHTYVYNTTGAVATSGTAGIPTYLSIAFSSAELDGFVAGQLVVLRIRRDADNTSATDSITANDVVLLEPSLLVEEA